MTSKYAPFIFLLLIHPTTFAQSAEQIKVNEEAIRQRMIILSRQLGVTCIECHNMKDLKDSSKKNFKISLEHMKITKALQDKGFDGKRGPEATCYMCHQGKLKPRYRETTE